MWAESCDIAEEVGRSVLARSAPLTGSRGVATRSRWVRFAGWVSFSAITFCWGWAGGWSKFGLSFFLWMTICSVAVVTEFVAAWIVPQQRFSVRGCAATAWTASFLSYAGAGLFIATTNSPVQLISVAWLMWLIAQRLHDPAFSKRPTSELVAIWTALALSCVARSNTTPILAIVLIGVMGTALSLSLRAIGIERVHEQPAPPHENVVGTTTQGYRAILGSTGQYFARSQQCNDGQLIHGS